MAVMDFSLISDSFRWASIFGEDWLIGILLSFLICILVTRQTSRWPIVLFPTIIALNISGVTFGETIFPLLSSLAGIAFLISTMSAQTLGRGISSITSKLRESVSSTGNIFTSLDQNQIEREGADSTGQKLFDSVRAKQTRGIARAFSMDPSEQTEARLSDIEKKKLRTSIELRNLRSKLNSLLDAEELEKLKKRATQGSSSVGFDTDQRRLTFSRSTRLE